MATITHICEDESATGVIQEKVEIVLGLPAVDSSGQVDVRRCLYESRQVNLSNPTAIHKADWQTAL